MNYKQFFCLVVFFVTAQINAQLAIAKSTVDGSGILDFATGTTNGVILPIVNALPTGIAATDGTLLMDNTDKIIKMRENGVWVSLTDAGSTTAYVFNNTTDTGNGVILGATTSAAAGILVLEANNKAFILPKVASPHTNVPSPSAGMVVYDTTSKSLAIFDGSKWNYWN